VVGKTLGHYRISDRLGKGGMGEVFRATDTRLDRQVALKTLPANVARNPERRARFEREAKVVASLNHPNIVTLHSVEEHQDVSFITMELSKGRPSLGLVRFRMFGDTTAGFLISAVLVRIVVGIETGFGWIRFEIVPIDWPARVADSL